jgi:hypothetical protein
MAINRVAILGQTMKPGKATNGRHHWTDLGPRPSKPPSIGLFGAISGKFWPILDFCRFFEIRRPKHEEMGKTTKTGF